MVPTCYLPEPGRSPYDCGDATISSVQLPWVALLRSCGAGASGLRSGESDNASVNFPSGARIYFLRRWRRKYCAGFAGVRATPLGCFLLTAKMASLCGLRGFVACAAASPVFVRGLDGYCAGRERVVDFASVLKGLDFVHCKFMGWN